MTVAAKYSTAAALHRQHRFAEAQRLYAQILKEQPDHPGALKGTGELTMKAARPLEAERLFARAIAVAPNDPDLHTERAAALRALRRYPEAIEAVERAISLGPKSARAWEVRSLVLADIGDLERALDANARAMALAPSRIDLRLAGLKFKTFLSSSEPADMTADAKAVAASISKVSSRPLSRWPNSPNPDRTIRLGFVSADLKDHPVGRFLLSLVTNLDPNVIELHAFSSTDRSDTTTAALKGRMRWHDVAMLDHAALARRISSEQIDVLVDLSGYTDGHRLAVFAQKPAPVSFTWLGYFASTGLKSIDYVLANKWVIPPSEVDQWVEKPWHMPDTYLCYAVPPDAPVPNDLPALAKGYITFGSFNNGRKISRATISAWSRLMKAVPSSELVLRSSAKLSNEFDGHLRNSFESEGIARERVRISPPLSDYGAHLRGYGEIDIALDPFPYNGGTTTVEALYMGVPVLVRAGDRYVAHMGESILHNVGLTDWIATDEADYPLRGASLAADFDGLAALRSGLRNQMLASPLFDAPRFASNFHDAVRGMWARWCESRR